MSREAILAIATDVRAFLEPVWHDWHSAWGGEPPAIAATNTCGRSSLFLQRVLAEAGFRAEWVSGVPSPDNSSDPVGFHDGQAWQSHAWVECEGLILDVTADQFGDRPIKMVSIDDETYRKGDGDRALPAFVAARNEAVSVIWPRWIASRRCVIV